MLPVVARGWQIVKKAEINQAVFGQRGDPVDLLGLGRWHYDIDADLITAEASWYRVIGLPETPPVTRVEDMKRLIHPEDVDVATRIDEAALAQLDDGPARYVTAFRIVRPDGSVRALRSVARLYRESGTGRRCAMGYVIDMTPEPELPSIRPDTGANEIEDAGNNAIAALSDGERECLSWAGHGKTAWETAQIMALSPRTVEFHLANAIAKLGAANKVHAAAIAVRLGLI